FDQPVSGKGKFNADAAHISNVLATLAMGGNEADIRGSFGAPGEKLLWRVDGKQLAAVRRDLYGTLVATGAVTGTMAAPRTSFEVDAKGLGWVPSARTGNLGAFHASGDAWLTAPAKNGARFVELKAKGTAQQFNPAALGSPMAGSINGSFDADGRLGPDWRGALNLALQPSTLGSSPLTGYAKIVADARHVSNADVDLRLGPNVVNAKGSFGAGSDVLNWRVDAPQLDALGPDFAGVLRGSGTVSGTMETPAVNAALEGQNLRLLGKHQIRSIKASANLGNGRGAADPLVSDIAVTGYVSGDTRVDTATLKTSGTRGAHALRFAARNADFDAAGDVQGGWSDGTWSGTVAALQNKGRYAFALQGPVPLRIAGAPGSGVMGLMSPTEVALRDAVIKLPNGTVSLQTLDKKGTRWT
ncbi:MAG: hypothetical protein WKG03_14320, partial [Telluria sp.]